MTRVYLAHSTWSRTMWYGYWQTEKTFVAPGQTWCSSSNNGVSRDYFPVCAFSIETLVQTETGSSIHWDALAIYSIYICGHGFVSSPWRPYVFLHYIQLFLLIQRVPLQGACARSTGVVFRMARRRIVQYTGVRPLQVLLQFSGMMLAI